MPSTKRTTLRLGQGENAETIWAYDLEVHSADERGWRISFELGHNAATPEWLYRKLTFETDGRRYLGEAVSVKPGMGARIELRGTALGSAKAASDIADDGFTSQRLYQAGPTLRFDGRAIGEYSTQNRDGTKDRWQELRLWETRGGAWIVERVGKSVMPGEGDMRECEVIEQGGDQERRMAAMEFLEWTAAARGFAREMGWKLERWVD